MTVFQPSLFHTTNIEALTASLTTPYFGTRTTVLLAQIDRTFSAEDAARRNITSVLPVHQHPLNCENLASGSRTFSLRGSGELPIRRVFGPLPTVVEERPFMARALSV